MIYRFIEIIPNYLYRGSAPEPEDILHLKNKYNIKNIISLDYLSAKKIERSCKILNINHIVIPINFNNLKKDILNLLRYNLKNLLLNNGPTFIHCFAGKDRTGLVVALFKIKYMDMNPEDALNEAKDIGMGMGLPFNIQKFLEKIILSCKKQEKINIKDTIVSNQREYKSDNRDSFLDESRQGSFAPYLNYTRQFPYDIVYNPINDQSREKNINNEKSNKTDIPLIGLFNNNAGQRGFGPTENYSGFFYE